jgi:hypothetical protein
VSKNFQEEIPLKIKSLLVVTLFVVACGFASAQSGSFALGFLSNTGGFQYCDYEEVLYSNPYAAGIHDSVDVCGAAANGVMVGFKGSIPATSGAPVTGAVYLLADNTFDSNSEAWTGCQIDWVTQSKASSKGNIEKGKYGWAYYYTCSGESDYLGNYGFLSKTLGARQGDGAAKSSIGEGRPEAKGGKGLLAQ